MLKERKVQNVRYTKMNDNSGSLDRFEITNRTIVPTFVPKPNIKAVDVTDLSLESQQEMAEALDGYDSYVKEQMKTVFSFEDWMSHTKNIHIEPKWRTFKVANIEVLS